MSVMEDLDGGYTSGDNKDNEELIETLKQKIKELESTPKHGDKKLFRDIVVDETKYEVIPATTEQMADAKSCAILARDYQIDNNGNVFKDKNGKERERFNECGNDMECVLKESSKDKLCGLNQSAGYPDLINDKKGYYLECKFANADKINTSFRSFYLSTLTKITKSQAHILVCFKHRNGKLSKDDEPVIQDLYDLELTLKVEWNASNKDVYPTNLIKPDYTLEDLDEIMDDNTINKREKNNKFSEISKRNKLKIGGKCELRYERLRENLYKFNED